MVKAPFIVDLHATTRERFPQRTQQNHSCAAQVRASAIKIVAHLYCNIPLPGYYNSRKSIHHRMLLRISRPGILPAGTLFPLLTASGRILLSRKHSGMRAGLSSF